MCAKEQIVKARELQSKEKKYVILDLNTREKTFKVHSTGWQLTCKTKRFDQSSQRQHEQQEVQQDVPQQDTGATPDPMPATLESQPQQRTADEDDQMELGEASAVS
ncbi:hypothetical protein HPB47_028447 [Ixodes persulcatus]|uniref:Uncharacterized protein n=1 Tax=Ixodes persulcatus TaxID=34615 RepID=A0AC60PTI9_IXOPE|nr:hypothetical protein HPB47_028447 [Ixodes persulcatus]